jgi:hypothetical protein
VVTVVITVRPDLGLREVKDLVMLTRGEAHVLADAVEMTTVSMIE